MASGDPVRTALYDEHIALDANVVDFHGFDAVGIQTLQKSICAGPAGLFVFHGFFVSRRECGDGWSQ